MNPEIEKLIAFIRAAKERGVSDEFLVSLLRQHGWSERRIYQGFSAHYEQTLGGPVPSRGTRVEQAREAFYYLLAFITLGFWTIALVWFGDLYIDRAYPSSLGIEYTASYFRSQVAVQLATVALAFPLFLFISFLIGKEVDRRPEAYESGVRKWLTYIALVITAIILLTDAVWFLSSFLSGDLTSRFVWKALVLFVVAAGVFWYYIGTMRGEGPQPVRERIFGWAATAGIALALVLGFAAIGSPARERSLSLDEQRVSHLSMIASSVHERYTASRTHALPRALSGIAGLDATILDDPVTNAPYRYLPVAGPRYELCATFDQPSDPNAEITVWTHPAGDKCYALDARNDITVTY